MLLEPQVKSTGYPRASWSPTEAELHTTITHTIDKAAGQLTSGRDTVHYIMPDLHLQQVTLVVALPYVTRAQLMKVGVVSADSLFICICNGPRAMQRRERETDKKNSTCSLTTVRVHVSIVFTQRTQISPLTLDVTTNRYFIVQRGTPNIF